nr:RtcB family protein [Paludibacterium paludis]
MRRNTPAATRYSPAAIETLGLNRKRRLLLVRSGTRGLGQYICRSLQSSGSGRRKRGVRGLSLAPQDRPAVRQDQPPIDRAAHTGETARRRHAGDRYRPQHARQRDGRQCARLAAPQGGRHRWIGVVIPGSRGDYSYLVEPVADEISLFSLAHGAGRKWMRSECKDRLSSRYSPQQLKRTAPGSHVVCDDRQLLFEEAPEAYKSIGTVIESLREAGLIHVIARLKPVPTYKPRGESV